MPTFRCSVCKQIHVIQRYDKEYICQNSIRQKKKFTNIIKNETITSNNWNFDEWNTREDVYRDVVVTDIKTMPSDKNRYLGGTHSQNW